LLCAAEPLPAASPRLGSGASSSSSASSPPAAAARASGAPSKEQRAPRCGRPWSREAGSRGFPRLSADKRPPSSSARARPSSPTAAPSAAGRCASSSATQDRSLLTASAGRRVFAAIFAAPEGTAALPVLLPQQLPPPALCRRRLPLPTRRRWKVRRWRHRAAWRHRGSLWPAARGRGGGSATVLESAPRPPRPCPRPAARRHASRRGRRQRRPQARQSPAPAPASAARAVPAASASSAREWSGPSSR